MIMKIGGVIIIGENDESLFGILCEREKETGQKIKMKSIEAEVKAIRNAHVTNATCSS